MCNDISESSYFWTTLQPQPSCHLKMKLFPVGEYICVGPLLTGEWAEWWEMCNHHSYHVLDLPSMSLCLDFCVELSHGSGLVMGVFYLNSQHLVHWWLINNIGMQTIAYWSSLSSLTLPKTVNENSSRFCTDGVWFPHVVHWSIILTPCLLFVHCQTGRTWDYELCVQWGLDSVCVKKRD